MTRVLKLGLTVVGVTDMRRAVTFWTQALRYDVKSGGPDATWTELGPAGEPGAVLALQYSDVPAQEYPRVHLDLHAGSAAEQAEQASHLRSLGATEVDWDRYPDDPDFVVLADPDGNRFCVVDASRL